MAEQLAEVSKGLWGTKSRAGRARDGHRRFLLKEMLDDLRHVESKMSILEKEIEQRLRGTFFVGVTASFLAGRRITHPYLRPQPGGPKILILPPHISGLGPESSWLILGLDRSGCA